MTVLPAITAALTLALTVACGSSTSPDAVCKKIAKFGTDLTQDDLANCKTLFEIMKDDIGDERYKKLSSCIMNAKDDDSVRQCSNDEINESEMETYVARAGDRWRGPLPSFVENGDVCSSPTDCGSQHSCVDGKCVDNLLAYSIRQRRLAFEFCGETRYPTTTRVECDDESIVDLAPLAKLTQLKTLVLDDSEVTDLRPLARLTKLTELNLEWAPLFALKPLAELTNLESLDLGHTRVFDVAALAGLAKLDTLILRGTQVSDLGPLAHLTQLYKLDLSDTSVSDVTALTKLTKLTELNLEGAFVPETQIQALQNALPKLQIRY